MSSEDSKKSVSSTAEKPTAIETNALGLTKKDYIGAASTLCQGCGHDSVTQHMMTALYNSEIDPHKIVKISGIGCSSKTPAYFLNQSFGFNTIHGRMAPIATGAKIANRDLHVIGISGDGDTASIGLGGFCHLVRRNLPMLYIVENNGVYGLTKGQFSATADPGTPTKSGDINPFSTIDLCGLAVELGCGFVARSFSGDSKQLVPLIQAALDYPGLSIIDVISPCIAFANHDGSTKSYTYVREHKFSNQELGFVPSKKEMTVDYADGEMQKIKWPSGGTLWLKKMGANDFDISDALASQKAIREARGKGQILTGLLHLDLRQQNYFSTQRAVQKNLAFAQEFDTRPSHSALAEMLSAFK